MRITENMQHAVVDAASLCDDDRFYFVLFYTWYAPWH
jgi:hypothetical protein